MIVLDASAAVELLVNRPRARKIRERIQDPAIQLAAPDLLTLEVAQVFRRHVAAGLLPAEEAADALRALRELGVQTFAHDLLVDRVWELRHNLTAYDAAYIALAELLDAPLLTTDAKLARAPGNSARIELVEG